MYCEKYLNKSGTSGSSIVLLMKEVRNLGENFASYGQRDHGDI
jgi:hypothetical protein